jgi:cellulose synthase/poly-beta-1,6-N-acetylglucosamine synthase-like glycosyltransferase
MLTFLHLLFLVFFLYFAGAVLYLFVLSFWGRSFRRRRKIELPEASPSNRILIMVPAYKEDGIILSTAANLLELDYPSSLYRVCIIADSFREDTLTQLRRLPLDVLPVSFEKSTKTKSLNAAFAKMGDDYTIALICDADNMLQKDFLKKINSAFVNGARAVQGKRIAKNLDSAFAILDACSEEIGNHIFKKGTYAIGLSSSVIGSGMAFDFRMVKEILGEIDAVGGFDKILQLKVVGRDVTIHYLEDAVLFDEKVGSSQAFKAQRKRWVSSQFIYLKKSFIPSCKALLKGNLNYFNLGVANNIVPPRSLLFIFLPLLTIAGFFVSPFQGFLSGGLLLLFLLTLGMGVPAAMVNRDLLRALLTLPRAIGIMFGTLLHLKKANKTFIHTVHTKTGVSNSLFNEGGE